MLLVRVRARSPRVRTQASLTGLIFIMRRVPEHRALHLSKRIVDVYVCTVRL